MRQSIVPVLLLAAVALSSSNVLPMMSTNQLESEIAVEGQQNDNIFSSRFNPRDILNKEFYTIPFGLPKRNIVLRNLENFNKNNNRPEESTNDVMNVNDDDYYDGEGFRKKQWHNYPRQLDRLQKFLFASHKTDKRTPETDDLDNPEGNDSTASSDRIDDISTNEYFLHSDGRHNIYDAVVAATNPLLILKIHLACLNKGIKHSLPTENELFQVEPKTISENKIEDEKLFSNKIYLGSKVKRENDVTLAVDNSGGYNA